MSSQATLATRSGVRVELALEVEGSVVRVTAVAIASSVTQEFDVTFAKESDSYARTAAMDGIAAAGEPPQSGAAALMSDLQVTPPPALRGVGRGITYVGGTGSEWKIDWVWNHSSDVQHGARFDVSSSVSRTTLSC
jgi:hypothetical protein